MKCDDNCLQCPLPRCIYDEPPVDVIMRKKRNEYNKRWRAAHKEAERLRLKKWYEAHREEHLAKAKARYHQKKGVKDAV